MAVVDGINHVAMLTTNLERKAQFYADMFDATLANVGQIPVEPHFRSGEITIGATCVLHVVEDPDCASMFPGRIGERGPLDHFGLRVKSRYELEEVRDRLVRSGASDGTVSDFGRALSVFYRDPDGMECEICWAKPTADEASVGDATSSASCCADNKALVRQLFDDVFSGRNLSVCDLIVAEDYIEHAVPPFREAAPGAVNGPLHMRSVVDLLHSWFPDLQMVVEGLVAEDDIVAVRVRCDGTHRGAINDLLPATGNGFAASQSHWYRVSGGRLAEHWAVRDDLTVMLQLGVVTVPTELRTPLAVRKSALSGNHVQP